MARLARSRSARAEEAAFVVEGPMLVSEALAAGVTLEALFVDASALGRPAVDEALARALEAGVSVWELAEGAISRLTDVVSPQGLVAVAARPSDDQPSARRPSFVVVLVDVADPGNAGTLLRVAEAAGAGSVVFCGDSVDPTNPKCVRASAGALFHVPVVIAGAPVDVLGQLRADGLVLVAAVVGDGPPYDSVDLRGPVAVVLGNEARGLPPALLATVDQPVTIPMAGRSESLNVAMAGSVLCFEVLRQRRRAADRA